MHQRNVQGEVTSPRRFPNKLHRLCECRYVRWDEVIPPYKYHTQLTQRKRTYPMNSADNEAIQNQRTRAVKTRIPC